jgi:hypothetical protein
MKPEKARRGDSGIMFLKLFSSAFADYHAWSFNTDWAIPQSPQFFVSCPLGEQRSLLSVAAVLKKDRLCQRPRLLQVNCQRQSARSASLVVAPPRER